MIRAFIAIEIPEQLQTVLGRVSRELTRGLTPRSVRWVKPQNVHLTLRFLGDVQPDKLDHIKRGIDEVVVRTAPLTLSLDSIGCFPNTKRPRIIWIGLAGDLDQLSMLHRTIEHMLDPLGWEPERRKFHPHLTLGRVKDPGIVADANLPWGRTLAQGRFIVDAVHIVESRLFPTGAIYSIRHSGTLDKTRSIVDGRQSRNLD